MSAVDRVSSGNLTSSYAMSKHGLVHALSVRFWPLVDVDQAGDQGTLSGLTYIASESGRRDTVAAARPSRPIYSAQGAHMKRRKRVRRCPLLVSLGG